MLRFGLSNKKSAKFNNLSHLKLGRLALAASLILSAHGANGDTHSAQAETEDDFEIVVRDPNAPTSAPQNTSQPTNVKRALRDDAPQEYIVKKGDTLWDISKTFLKTPWTWPELWYFNPQIVNPHLIYPGDKLVLIYVDGQPRLQRAGDDTPSVSIGSGQGTVSFQKQADTTVKKVVKLSPKVRRQSFDNAVSTVEYSEVSPFLSSSQILTADQIEDSPKIIGSIDDHLISGINNTIYVENLPPSEFSRYEILRPGRVFRSPENNEILGYEGIEIGEAQLQAYDSEKQLGTFLITTNVREVLNRDLVLPSKNSANVFNSVPRPPSDEINASIIALHDAIGNVARNQVVIIDAGARDGLELGNVIAIDQRGATIRRRSKSGRDLDSMTLPDISAGLGLVFRVYDRVSYVLITESNRAIHVGDKIRNPDPAKDAI
jgi:LysM repeat protein